MSITLSVIVPTHDRPAELAATVDALLRQSRLPDELIVVNDGSAEIDRSIASRVAAAGVKFLYRRREAPSSSASRNCGLELASGDVAVLLDDDVEPPREFLSRLAALYEMDSQRRVAGISGRYLEPHSLRWTQRLWQTLAAALAENRWAPRLSLARYVRLPGPLAGRLVPAWRMVGGVMSLRRRIYTTYRFTEAFPGYSLAEDTELSLRIGAAEPLFLAPELTVLHRKAATGRPDDFHRGRMYVAHMLYIAGSAVQGGAGTWLLLGYHLVGMILLASAWSLLSWRPHNLHLAAGMVAELCSRLRGALGRLLCG